LVYKKGGNYMIFYAISENNKNWIGVAILEGKKYITKNTYITAEEAILAAELSFGR
jgi:hypothetical protein